MPRNPAIFRVCQPSYARCINTFAQNRYLNTTRTLSTAESYNNDDCLHSPKVQENLARRKTRAPSSFKQRVTRQDASPRQSKRKSLIPLGIRIHGRELAIPPRKEIDSDEISSWERRIVAIRHSYGDQGTWETFLELRKHGDIHLITESRAVFLRDNILKAALAHPDRMEELFTFAQGLQEKYHFDWPEFYLKVVHFYLAHTDYDAAFRWHLKLLPAFRPDLDSFGALLASFAIDFSPKNQSTLTRMYAFNPYRGLYDYVVPALFDSGQSHPARVWRKRFILFNDHAKSPKSMPFLDFLSRYFPNVQLTTEELTILKGESGVSNRTASLGPGDTQSDQDKGIYSDKFTARWFASSWTSSEFAISLMHKLGLRRVGSQSLQSVALREDDARGVAQRLAQFRDLGMNIAPTVYCKALISFAERGEDDLLRDLLHCDIHPAEFDNSEVRLMLLAASAKEQDWRREQLLQEIEALATQPVSKQNKGLSWELNRNLSIALSAKGLAQVRSVLDKMDTMSVTLEQKNSEGLLYRVFEDIWYHPKRSKQKIHGLQGDPEVDRAIHLSLRVARHGVAIPIRYWQMLLYNLGRLGRFKELEEFSYEICEIYSPDPGGLIPVHWRDIPKPNPKPNDSDSEQGAWPHYYSYPDGKKKQSHFKEEFWRAEIGSVQDDLDVSSTKLTSDNKTRASSQKRHKSDYVFCIPADLPFTNRQHPIQKIFDINLQRAILRWGFDITLGLEPTQAALTKLKPTGVTDFDLACGVRLLALLRDKGVYIDEQVVRSAIINRLVVAHVPGRTRARARDDRELSPAHMKQLVEEAWGSEILPSEAQLASEIATQRPKVWKSYSKLLRQSYDKKRSN
ncbi:hypothetical protein FHETE_644 [Fusarium heterosporum]|uniref:Pentatricopeptide repeat domain-containing protein n=1 Tax=Fusarium heterosporum TaxID=42747 RepID=A0A8H5U2E7_FUSHE|nr:hypothetical protein FHETE_644 [Fusarium heterosporum]